MSALPKIVPRHRRMVIGDLDAVMAIERSIYAHPWTRGNFSDSLDAGYHCWITEMDGGIAGYSVMMIAAQEAHLLNLAIAAPWQRRGAGRELLKALLDFAREYQSHSMYLEVRPSNVAARALYQQAGFRQVGVRRGYYPAGTEREDALVLELQLT